MPFSLNRTIKAAGSTCGGCCSGQRQLSVLPPLTRVAMPTFPHARYTSTPGHILHRQMYRYMHVLLFSLTTLYRDPERMVAVRRGGTAQHRARTHRLLQHAARGRGKLQM